MNVLLLEPGYRSKFPPIGLMKIAAYHKSRGDNVRFAKGKLPAGHPIKKWDRVYVTTLFTFEWQRTVNTVHYAKTLVDSPDRVTVGGIAASLMPGEYERETGIKPLCGLLTDSSMLGYDDRVNIDRLVPDYSILDHTPYRYRFENGYFLTATRGCGMNCGFCAVQTLEPEYCDYIPIIPRVEEIRRLYGEKKNLYLLDNNVLLSRSLPKIIEDIEALGFHRGATWTNPKTGKQNMRSVDFNQGLDMNLMNEETMSLLGRIALKPFHIAFDHISDTERYKNAIGLAAKHDILNSCSYLLYSTPGYIGKGKHRDADTPRDLYERCRVNVELKKQINRQRAAAGKRDINPFSFPIRYMPLDAKDRSYIGPHWNRKLISGLNAMLGPSHAGMYASEPYFLRVMGEAPEEFEQRLLMPNEYLGTLAKDCPDAREWERLRRLWKHSFDRLTETQKAAFFHAVKDNAPDAEAYVRISSNAVRHLCLHYFHNQKRTNFLNQLKTLNMAHYYEACHHYGTLDRPAALVV